MSNVEFDEDQSLNNFTSRKIFGDSVEPGIARLLRKLGIIKNPTQAKYIMIAVIILCFGLAAYIFFFMIR